MRVSLPGAFSAGSKALPLKTRRAFIRDRFSFLGQKRAIAVQPEKSRETGGLSPGPFGTPVSVAFPGQCKPHEFSPFWLRDNCLCTQCTHPDTRQRILDTDSIPFDVQPKNLTVTEDKGLEIEWSNDGHVSRYDWSWLRSHVASSNPSVPTLRSDCKRVPNDPASFPTVKYEEVMGSDSGVGEWTRKIHVYGFCLVEGCPVEPEATQKLLERIAFIRQTHYGGFWDFTSNLALKDMAYTTQGLGVHTDNAYFTDPAGLQMFHLLSHTGGSGGESLLVDGFHAAHTLSKESLSDYKTLMRRTFKHHASGNEDVCIEPDNYTSTLMHKSGSNELIQVRWNNEDRGAAFVGDEQKLHEWYSAARKFSEILKRPDFELRFQLEPGTPLIFDNWRMLHGRTAFSGARRICGAYINRDDFMSRYNLLNKGRKQTLAEI